MHAYSFAAVARCDALRLLLVYTMALSCAFELLFFTQDRLHASIPVVTESSWSWLVCTERQQSRLSKSALPQNTCGSMM